MSRRFKTGTMRFGVPLSVPASLHVERCYGMHGKGYAGCPPRSSDLDLVLVNAERTLRTVDGFYPEHHKFLTDAVGLGGDGWKILGWRMSDGSLPLGEHDTIDPELAQFDYLPSPNATEVPERRFLPHAAPSHGCAPSG